MDAFFAVSSHRSGKCEVIELTGELDMASAPRLVALLDRMLVIPEQIVVDVEGLTFIDSSGLGLLLRASQLVEGRIRLRGCSQQMARVLDISGLSSAFTLEEATAAAAS